MFNVEEETGRNARKCRIKVKLGDPSCRNSRARKEGKFGEDCGVDSRLPIERSRSSATTASVDD